MKTNEQQRNDIDRIDYRNNLHSDNCPLDLHHEQVRQQARIRNADMVVLALALRGGVKTNGNDKRSNEVQTQ